MGKIKVGTKVKLKENYHEFGGQTKTRMLSRMTPPFTVVHIFNERLILVQDANSLRTEAGVKRFVPYEEWTVSYYKLEDANEG